MYKILKGQSEAVNPRKADNRQNRQMYRHTIRSRKVQDTKGAIRSRKS